MHPTELMHAMFDAAIASAQPQRCVAAHLPHRDEVQGRLIVIGAGKASAAMARAVEDHWDGPMSGLVVTRYGYDVPCERIEIVQAAHPVPDLAGLCAAQRMLDAVQGLSADDVVLCLISGGGSALLPLPLPGLDLQDLQAINQSLLACGATIGEMNTLRRHLSGIQGGRLAAACHPARVISLLMSDVPGDDAIHVASGPTVPDPTTCADALAIVARYRVALPHTAHALLTSGEGESVKPDDPRMQGLTTRWVATPRQALHAAAEVAQQHGYTPLVLSDAIEGEARDVGKVLAALALHAAQDNAAFASPFPRPCALLSGGETTVTLDRRGGPVGRGGRNVECLLAFALATQGHPRLHALMGDTDGVDGAEDIAGAHIGPDTLARAHAMGLSPRAHLDAHDGHGFFQALGQSVVTGPTRTNVNDFRVILIDA